MKVQKFSAIATVKIINELNRMEPQFASSNPKVAPIEEYKEMILQARDKWITGHLPSVYNTKLDSIKINEEDNGTIVVELSNLVFRINGDFVSKEQAI